MNTETKVRGTAATTSPAQAMNAAPRARAVQPAWPAAVGSPRPSAWPTRTAPAEASPRGIMKVTLEMSSTMWCAARATGSSIPARVVAAAKTPTSSVTWTAAGSPIATSRAICAQMRPKRRRASGRSMAKVVVNRIDDSTAAM